jgi:hypothetical protein
VKKYLLTGVLALVVAVLGFAVSGVAVASNGNADTPQTNPCPPGEHAVYDQNGEFVSCEHNGDGGGNCGQNQSGNGGDNGYGDDEDGCTVTTPTDTTPTETTPTETTPGGPVCPDGGPNTSGKDGQPGNDACADQETTLTETTPTTPEETTPAQPSQPPASSPPASKPSIVGTPPKAQHSPAKAKQHPAKSAVAGFSAKSAPKPTRQPQPAPFTL